MPNLERNEEQTNEPQYERQLFSARTIDRAIRRTASEIISDYQESERQVTFVYIPEGANSFWVDLDRELWDRGMRDHRSIPLVIKSYSGINQSSEPRVVLGISPEINLEEDEVLLVDDIAEKWKTIAEAKKYLGVDPKVCVMIDKPDGRLKEYRDKSPDYASLRLKGSPWVEGRGLDSNGYGRGRRNIVEISSEPFPPIYRRISSRAITVYEALRNPS